MATFSELFQSIRADGKAEQNWTISKLAALPATVATIESKLTEHGITHFPLTTLGGAMSLVALLPEKNHVLRIVDATQERSPTGNPLMLQPIVGMGEVDGFRIQLFPKVRLLDEQIANGTINKKDTLDAITRLVNQFEAQGLLFWDVKLANLCVDDKNEIKLLDFGSVCPISERDKGQIGHDTHSYNDKYRANMAYLQKELGSQIPAANPDTNWTVKIVIQIGGISR